MNLTFIERKTQLGPETRRYAEKKAAKLQKYFKDECEAALKVSFERGIYTVELTVVAGHVVLRAQEKSGDETAAIDVVIGVIERQIEKNKSRIDKKIRGGAEQTIRGGVSVPEESYELIRRKRFELKPMTVDEAILQMNLVGHQFFAFKNAEDGNRFCVVYTRLDKGYGLIESE